MAYYILSIEKGAALVVALGFDAFDLLPAGELFLQGEGEADVEEVRSVTR